MTQTSPSAPASRPERDVLSIQPSELRDTIRLTIDRELVDELDRRRGSVAQASTETDLDLLLGDTTLAAALDRAVTVIAPDPAVLPAIIDTLPQHAHLGLNPLALTLTSQLTNHLRDLAAANPAAYELDPREACSLSVLVLSVKPSDWRGVWLGGGVGRVRADAQPYLGPRSGWLRDRRHDG